MSKPAAAASDAATAGQTGAMPPQAASSSVEDVIEGAGQAVGLSDHTINVLQTDYNIVRGDAEDVVVKGEDVVQSATRDAANLLSKGANVLEGVATDVKDKVTRFFSGDPEPPPAGPITLTHETEARTPANRARTKIGIGEVVTLTVTPGPGMWDVSGAELNARKGGSVTMTATGHPGKVEVTVTVGSQTCKVTFDVVAPTEVHQQVSGGRTQHAAAASLPDNKPLPNGGFYSDIFIGPDDVSFKNIKFIEREVGAVGSGSWAGKSGEGHGPNKSPLGMSDTIVAGKGTQADATDHCWTGFIPGVTGPDWTGKASWSIPWLFAVGTARGAITNVPMDVVTAADGTTVISKVGATFTTHLTDGTFGF